MTGMGQRRDVGRGIGAIGIIGGINLVIGFVGYFIAFVFAYGFRDEIRLAEHNFFLVMIAAIAAAGAIVSTFVIKPALHLTLRQSAALAISVSAAINLLVVGLGSIVSAQHKDEGSVSADFSTTTDVIVAACLLGGAAAAGWFVWRAVPEKA